MSPLISPKDDTLNFYQPSKSPERRHYYGSFSVVARRSILNGKRVYYKDGVEYPPRLKISHNISNILKFMNRVARQDYTFYSFPSVQSFFYCYLREVGDSLEKETMTDISEHNRKHWEYVSFLPPKTYPPENTHRN